MGYGKSRKMRIHVNAFVGKVAKGECYARGLVLVSVMACLLKISKTSNDGVLGSF